MSCNVIYDVRCDGVEIRNHPVTNFQGQYQPGRTYLTGDIVINSGTVYLSLIGDCGNGNTSELISSNWKRLNGITSVKTIFDGNGSYTVPNGITYIAVSTIGGQGGGGGGGGSAGTPNRAGGGGGGGGYGLVGNVVTGIVEVYSGQLLTIAVGDGGTGGSGGHGGPGPADTTGGPVIPPQDNAQDGQDGTPGGATVLRSGSITLVQSNGGIAGTGGKGNPTTSTVTVSGGSVGGGNSSPWQFLGGDYYSYGGLGGVAPNGTSSGGKGADINTLDFFGNTGQAGTNGSSGLMTITYFITIGYKSATLKNDYISGDLYPIRLTISNIFSFTVPGSVSILSVYMSTDSGSLESDLYLNSGDLLIIEILSSRTHIIHDNQVLLTLAGSSGVVIIDWYQSHIIQ